MAEYWGRLYAFYLPDVVQGLVEAGVAEDGLFVSTFTPKIYFSFFFHPCVTFKNLPRINGIMSTVKQLIGYFGLHPGYVVQARARSCTDPFNHYIIYVGFMSFPDPSGTLRAQHVFAANMPPKGEQLIGEHKAIELFQKYYPTDVQACYRGQPCNPLHTAQRAYILTQVSQARYNLLLNNCQDFAQQATTGQKGSYQRENVMVGLGMLFLGIIVHYTNKYTLTLIHNG